jgi:hypothetical protein
MQINSPVSECLRISSVNKHIRHRPGNQTLFSVPLRTAPMRKLYSSWALNSEVIVFLRMSPVSDYERHYACNWTHQWLQLPVPPGLQPTQGRPLPTSTWRAPSASPLAPTTILQQIRDNFSCGITGLSRYSSAKIEGEYYLLNVILLWWTVNLLITEFPVT